MEVKTYSQLMAALKQKALEVTMESVIPAVKELESQNVDTFVYSVYENPIVYNRRKDDGGLSDVDNMEHSVSAGGNQINVEIENMTTDKSNSSRFISGAVEEGGNPWGKDGAWNEPRRFGEATRFMLKSGALKDFYIKGFKKKQIKAW